MSLDEALGELLGEELDSEVFEYIKGVLGEYDETESALEDIRETISGFSPKFELLPPEQQEISIISLLQLQTAAARASPCDTSTAPCSRDQAELRDAHTTENITDRHDNRLEPPAAAPQPAPPNDIQSTSEPQPPTHQDNNEELLLLASLYPFPVPSELLSDVLHQQCAGCLQTAANRILEQSPEDVKTDLAAWEAAQRKKEQASGHHVPSPDAKHFLRPDEELRRSIVARFHLETVPVGGADGGTGKGGGVRRPHSIAAWGAQGPGNGNAKQAQMRYREGVVVSTKGDKFIVEKPPEWDGGSRGKVKSKRKGGVGWH